MTLRPRGWTDDRQGYTLSAQTDELESINSENTLISHDWSTTRGSSTSSRNSFLRSFVVGLVEEPVSEVAHLISTLRAMPSLQDAAVHIYIKDEDASVSEIQRLTGATNVTKIPNVGREGETNIYHILNQWDNLAKHTFFLQANVHSP